MRSKLKHCRPCEDVGHGTPPGVLIPEVHIEVEGERLTATMPGTTFTVDFFRQPDRQGIVQSELSENDSATQISCHDFEELAWEAANQKARELGWIR